MSFPEARLAAAQFDPETLIGPLLHLLTQRVTRGSRCVSDALLADRLTLVALHPRVDPLLRLAAGALAIEHRA